MEATDVGMTKIVEIVHRFERLALAFEGGKWVGAGGAPRLLRVWPDHPHCAKAAILFLCLFFRFLLCVSVPVLLGHRC